MVQVKGSWFNRSSNMGRVELAKGHNYILPRKPERHRLQGVTAADRSHDGRCPEHRAPGLPVPPPSDFGQASLGIRMGRIKDHPSQRVCLADTVLAAITRQPLALQRRQLRLQIGQVRLPSQLPTGWSGTGPWDHPPRPTLVGGVSGWRRASSMGPTSLW